MGTGDVIQTPFWTTPEASRVKGQMLHTGVAWKAPRKGPDCTWSVFPTLHDKALSGF